MSLCIFHPSLQQVSKVRTRAIFRTPVQFVVGFFFRYDILCTVLLKLCRNPTVLHTRRVGCGTSNSSGWNRLEPFFFSVEKKVRGGFSSTRWSFSIYLPIYLYRRFVSRRLYVNLPIFPMLYDENKQQPHRLKKNNQR